MEVRSNDEVHNNDEMRQYRQAKRRKQLPINDRIIGNNDKIVSKTGPFATITTYDDIEIVAETGANRMDSQKDGGKSPINALTNFR